MSARTKFQDVRAALTADISAQLTTDGVTGVTVTEYPPLGDFAREDRVFIRSISFSQEPYTYTDYQELLEIDLTVLAPTFGGTNDEQSEGEQRAEAIFDSVLAVIRADITVSGTVFNIELADAESKVEVIDEHGPHGAIEATFTAEAHI